MKRLLAVLLLSLPLHAEIMFGDYTINDISVKVDKAVWKFTNPDGQPSPYAHAFVYLQLYTPDVKADAYHVSLKYRANGVETTSVKDVYARRWSDMGWTGEQGQQQVEVRTGFQLPTEAEVLSVDVSKVQFNTLGSALITQTSVPQVQRPPSFDAQVGDPRTPAFRVIER